jgi:hypothetical protein
LSSSGRDNRVNGGKGRVRGRRDDKERTVVLVQVLSTRGRSELRGRREEVRAREEETTLTIFAKSKSGELSLLLRRRGRRRQARTDDDDERTSSGVARTNEREREEEDCKATRTKNDERKTSVCCSTSSSPPTQKYTCAFSMNTPETRKRQIRKTHRAPPLDRLLRIERVRRWLTRRSWRASGGRSRRRWLFIA